ncbi:DUF4153 domain-containing protein [Caulobacter henricii]|uniref:Transporter n=1 Tax=Caulobacter henricii TaxID=69395 RepID=A0A0P0P376_9CAUL|nr:DUF4153 domain-containing protein [Caulobacter henricii]ALL14739.1 transporter [Caulobacter henricii]
MDLTASPSARTTTAIRLGVGFLQGLALFLLHHVQTAKLWPSTEPLIFAPLMLVAAFAPFVVLAGVGALKRKSLIVWTLGAAILTAGLAWHGAWQGVDGDRMPDAPVFLAIAAGLFIAHHLIQPAQAERRWVAAYPAYFDITWMHGVQLALSVAFTGAFWILLFLGSSLFKLIGIEAFQKLISEEAFAYPATTVMFAAAVQLTDVRSTLVRGVRTVALTLLAWLLPLMTLIAAGFLASLPFTGLEPLWKTKAATALLLTAAAHLIVLINAAYQDGEDAPHLVLKWAARIAGLLLVPISLLAAYGLALRIGQYGLTPERVFAAAFVVIAAGYALGYTIAAVRPGAWMKALERTNIAQAFVAIALILALFTPIADPARLSVQDQVGRLERGTVKAEAFDFQFLRFDSGPYGKAALERLKTSQDAAIARLAREASAQTEKTPPKPEKPDLSKIKVFPTGANLPASFAGQAWGDESGSSCLYSGSECLALLLDTDGDQTDEVLLAAGNAFDIFKSVDGRWRKVAETQAGCQSAALDAALKKGPIRMSESVQRRDLLVGDLRLTLTPAGPGCAF